MFAIPLRILLFLSFVSVSFLTAAYAPLETPEKWKILVLTEAFDPENPDTKLGDFQKGLEVKVMEVKEDSQQWLVRYQARGANPVDALIAIPDLSEVYQSDYEAVAEYIEEFKLLKKLLELDEPWPADIRQLTYSLVRGEQTLILAGSQEEPTILRSEEGHFDARAYGMEPMNLDIDYTIPRKPKVVVEFWNKAESKRARVKPFKARKELMAALERIERAFRTRPIMNDEKRSSGIASVKMKAESYYLPNDLVAHVRYRKGEYLLFEFEPYSMAEELDLSVDAIEARMKESVQTDDKGYVHVDGIPMMTQGNKGYCAAATLARVLSYYGYDVDMHSMAELAKTEAYGTTIDDVLKSMRRVASNTPFRFNNLDPHNLHEITAKLDQGIPIIWLIPGHARLIIGYHPDTGEVVYSDSWGAGHEFKIMENSEFFNLSRYAMVLEPK